MSESPQAPAQTLIQSEWASRWISQEFGCWQVQLQDHDSIDMCYAAQQVELP